MEQRENNQKRIVFQIFLMTIIFFIAGCIGLKNKLFFKSSNIFNVETDENSMYMYQYIIDEDLFAAADNSASINIAGVTSNANEVIVEFERGLEEDSRFMLYSLSEPGGGLTLLEDRIVRKNFKKIVFNYFEDTLPYDLRLIILSPGGDRFVKLPKGRICINDRKVNLLPLNVECIRTMFILFVVSLSLSILINLLRKKYKTISNRRNNRDSNLELLRIICMLFLVAHHFAVHGGLLNLPFSVPKYVGLFFLPVGKICFTAYIAISMYFLVDGNNKIERFMNCWLEVAFYSVSLTVVSWTMGGVVLPKAFISSFFVMISNSHGFAASYLLFLLVYPFVLKATKDCTKAQARFLLLLLFWIQILSQIFRAWTGYNQPVYSELTLFVFCYFLSLNLKRYPVMIFDNKVFDLIIIIGVWTFSFTLHTTNYFMGLNETGYFLAGITSDESSIFYIVSGYALFYLFKNIKVKHSNFINFIATGTFGVLLIHDHNFLRHQFWNEIVRTQNIYSSDHFIVVFFAIVFSIFGVGITIDFIRRELLEKPIINSRLYERVSNWMNGVINNE